MKAYIYPVNYKQSYDLNTISFPITAYLKVTDVCMFNCPFCSQGKSNRNHMDIVLAKKILKELKEIGVRTITYTGGEPLIYNNIIDVVKYGHELGFKQILVSNLFNLYLNNNEQVLDYIDSIGVSFHGREVTYNKIVGNRRGFKVLVENIDKVIKTGKNVNLNYTISQENLNKDDLLFAFNFAKARNLRLCFGRLNYIGLSHNTSIIDPKKYINIINDFKNKYDKIEISNCIPMCALNDENTKFNHGCGVGISMVSFETNGDVTICPSSKIVLGNIKKQNIKKIWNSKTLNDFRKMKFLSNDCRLCRHLSICKGGCHAEGSGLFFKDNCDALLLKKHEMVWNKIFDKTIYLKFCDYRKESNQFLLLANPSRLVNESGFKIISEIDGTKTPTDIVNNNPNIDNIKDFLIAIYLDDLIGVNYEKEKN